MKSLRKLVPLVLLASSTIISVVPIQAQRRSMNTFTPSYTPAPRPSFRSEPEPERRQEPQYRAESRSFEQRQYNQQNFQSEERSYGNGQSEQRSALGANHPNATVSRPAVMSSVMRHAMTYNTRPNGVHIQPEYFASHFGSQHGFHFTGWGPNCPTCGFTVLNGEWYFNWNGANFGVMGVIPGNWALGSDYLYVDVGDDGNYYLYDAQNPDLAIQLTFVQNLGDDQAGADDQG
jgi:hypothetical protein